MLSSCSYSLSCVYLHKDTLRLLNLFCFPFKRKWKAKENQQNLVFYVRKEPEVGIEIKNQFV